MKYSLNSLVDKIVRFLGLTNKVNQQETLIERQLTREEEMFLYKIIASGNASDIDKVFRELIGNNYYFWGSDIDTEHPICKRTYGLASDVVGVYTNLFSEKFNGIEINKNDEIDELFTKIEKKNNINKFIIDMVGKIGQTGGGAIKYNLNSNNDLPTFEFVDNQFISKEYDCNELKEIIFYYFYSHNYKKYQLREKYGKGYIKYELYRDDKLVDLNEIPQTEGLADIDFIYTNLDGVAERANFILATDVQLGQSKEWEHYGESLFEGKIDAYDMLDELVTFNGVTVRTAWPKVAYPDNKIAKKDGRVNFARTIYNSFYSKPLVNTEKIDTSIDIVQGNLAAQDYQILLTTRIENCVLGKVSVNDLGINATHYNSDDDQRERSKCTMYTYNKYKSLLEVVLTDMVQKLFTIYNWTHDAEPDIVVEDKDIFIKIDTYSSPSFESKIEVCKNGMDVLSIEDQIDLLYGDGITEEERAIKIRSLYIMRYGVECLDDLLTKKETETKNNQEKAIPEKDDIKKEETK